VTGAARIPHDSVDRLSIALRAYAEPPRPKSRGKRPMPCPSEWTLIFDTETRIDAGQALRFGTYQVRESLELDEAGLFYRPEVVSDDEVAVLTDYAKRNGLRLLTQAAFINDVFFGIGYDLRATIVGFNLPFDISRLAIGFGPARGRMRGGFSFTLSDDKRRPHVQVKHLSRRASFIQFAAPFRQRTGRSDRKRGATAPVRRGFFVDVNTLANALFARPFKLSTLGEHLETPTRKAETEEHGGKLTETYMGYAYQDVQVTWECYAELIRQYAELKLNTPVQRIYSEASIGKAYLNAMGVKPWRNVQPDVPPDLLGIVLSTYFGGRSEVRIRRERRQVALCDFLSMYPTVCTLMGLWRFVIAHGMAWQDNTDEIRAFLDRTTINELQRPGTWGEMLALVQVEAEGGIFPVRATYDAGGATTIGLNRLTCSEQLWFTLADCVVSKLRTGRAPTIVRAIVFEPGPPQTSLQSVAISGNPDYAVTPTHDDFYKRLIELRQTVKARRDGAPSKHRDRLDAEQNALKIAANATSYGVFVEVNVTDGDKQQQVRVHTGGAEPLDVPTGKIEAPGRFFHPLLATLITGAARLMLAITETLAVNRGLEWAFCDTDSMAIAKPDGVEQTDFNTCVEAVAAWFQHLNPYAFDASILKIEDVNFSLADKRKRDPLFCYAVSAKRYVLFNLDADGTPVLRKASAHGLGHLRPPYDESKMAANAPRPKMPLNKIGVELWQHDLWWIIADASGYGPVVRVPLDYHPALRGPAVSRYGATTPVIQRWFKRYNEGRSYDEQVKPFGFLLAFTAADEAAGQPVAPFDLDHDRAAANALDRETGLPVPLSALKTYQTALAQYHLHPESKFHNGRHLDSGTTARRHVHAIGATYIGKEADRWEEQFFLGVDADAAIDYGTGPTGEDALRSELKEAASRLGQRQLADALGIARGTLVRWLRGDAVRLARGRLIHITNGLAFIRADCEREARERAAMRARLEFEVATAGLTPTAHRLGMDASNLAKMLAGARQLPLR